MQAKTVPEEELARQKQFTEKIRALNDACYHNGGRRRKACVQTYGCQQNESDSEKLRGMLEQMGYGAAESPEDADLVLFNTCAVREHAEQRVYGNVGALKPLKTRNPSMVIGLCGCMTQQEHVAEKIRGNYPYVDLVFGTGVLHRLPEMLCGVLEKGGRVFDLSGGDVIAEGLPVRREGTIRAWLPVSYGCNNFCTYCVVPYVRGRERSRAPESVLSEARSLISQGFRDITLLGQNVNSYGADLGADYRFPRLLRDIAGIEGDYRLRFMTSHPKDATEELFRAVAECERVSKHIHLPFQAGSDQILRQMNRRYTRDGYLSLVEKAKEIIPELSLTSDVIVGFPGETYEDFRQTLEVVRKVEFDGLYTFIYSPRKGTPAEKMEDPVAHGEKVKWFDELLAVQDEITRKRLNRLVGRTLRVLCEGPSRSGNGAMAGRTDAGTLIDFPAEAKLTGKFVQVRVTKALKFMLLGEMLPEKRNKSVGMEKTHGYFGKSKGTEHGDKPGRTVQKASAC